MEECFVHSFIGIFCTFPIDEIHRARLTAYQGYRLPISNEVMACERAAGYTGLFMVVTSNLNVSKDFLERLKLKQTSEKGVAT